MKRKRYTLMFTVIFLAMSICGVSGGEEPAPPVVDKVLSPEQEARIARVAALSVRDCFEELKRPEVVLDDDLSNRMAFQCFNSRRSQALQYLATRLNQAAYSIEGEVVVPNVDLYAAKIVSNVFAGNAQSVLINIYGTSNAQKKANILYVIGQMSGTAARNLLIEALDDQTFYEETTPEMEGTPMRICDMAYNQLRLRYAEEMEDLPRVIANPHRLEIRDSYIDEMYSRF